MSQVDFSPDIVERIENLTKKAIEKRKVIQDFIGILQDRANLEDYYSRNLEKISESLTRLIHGKDHLKEIFLILRNYVSIQAEQSRGLARQIKNEVVQDIQQLLAKEQPWQRDTQAIGKRHAKDVKAYIDKLNQLRNEYIISVKEEIKMQLDSQYKQRFPKTRNQCESQLRGYIDHYNKYIESYFLDIALIQETFTNLEVERRLALQDSTMKLLMYEVSVVRNLQYDLNGITQKLEAYNGKLDLKDLFQEPQNDKPLLCKLNFVNYQNFLHQSINIYPSLINLQPVQRNPGDDGKRKRSIFSEVTNEQPQALRIQTLVQDQTNPLLLKLFQNALLNNSVSDQSIQALQEYVQNDEKAMQFFPTSLERILALSLSQSETSQIEISHTGYISLLRIIQVFLDRVNQKHISDMISLTNHCKRIYRRIINQDNQNEIKIHTVKDGLLLHQIFQDQQFWAEWGINQINLKFIQFQKQQEELVFNEKAPQSESDFFFQEVLNTMNDLREYGCSSEVCSQVKSQMMQTLQITDQMREKISSEIIDKQMVSYAEESSLEHSVLS